MVQQPAGGRIFYESIYTFVPEWPEISGWWVGASTWDGKGGGGHHADAAAVRTTAQTRYFLSEQENPISASSIQSDTHES